MAMKQPSRDPGRPPSDPQSSRFWETELHTLLSSRLSHIEGMVVDGRIIPSRLAKLCNCCRFTAYRWLGSNRISPKGARKVIEISGGTLAREDFTPFLIL